VLVLLPPSEGKSAPAAGPPVELDRLSLPSLTTARRTTLAALADLCRSDADHARQVLGLSARQADEVTRNTDLLHAPAAPAREVYSGVLYQSLGYQGASPTARHRLDEWVLVWSGLWGAVRLTDRIPAYRLAGSVSLPPLGPLPAHWRPHLDQALAAPAGHHVILDLRSGTYASSWMGPAASTVVGRVIHDHDGRRTVASHFNKATKGRLVRALAEQGAQPTTLDELIDAIRSAGFRAEPSPGGMGATRRPLVLDIVVTTL
jgi:hypothetical protein